MTDNDDRKRDTDYAPEDEPTTDPGAEVPKRSVQDILADYRASRNAPPLAEPGKDLVEDELPEAGELPDEDDLMDEDGLLGGDEQADDVPGSPAGRRAALRSAGIQSSLLDIEEKQQRAMHEAVRFRPPSEDEDGDDDAK